MSRSVFLLVAGWVLMSSAPLVAQDAVLGQIYGKGVHAYFGQDFLKAHEQFTAAIDGHTQDPRCFYFRGLTLLKLGRPEDADLDFQRSAKLESSIDPTRAFNVARSLERVQGSEHSALEKYRLEARMAVLKKAEDERRVKYDEGLKEQRAFLQQQSEASQAKPVEPSAETTKPVEVPSEPGKAAGAVPANTPPADPFSTGDAGKPGEPKKEETGAGATPAAPAKPEVVPAGPVKVDVEKPDAAKPAGDTSDPFGGGDKKPDAAPAGGAKPNVEKPDAAKPDAAKPAGDASDPFGAGGDDKKPAGSASPMLLNQTPPNQTPPSPMPPSPMPPSPMPPSRLATQAIHLVLVAMTRNPPVLPRPVKRPPNRLRRTGG